MGIISRIRRVLEANIHEMLDRAEDPVKIANYLIIEMQEAIEQARGETASAMAAQKRLAQQAGEAELAALRWEERARMAVARGDDEMAREALRRQAAAIEMAMQYRQADQEQVLAVEELRQALEKLQQRYREAKARRATLLAEYNTTRAHQLISRSLHQAVGEDAFSTFDRLAGQLTTERHRAIALQELQRDDTEDAFLIAEEADAIEHKLSSMKQELTAVQAADDPKALEQQGDPR